MIDIEINGIPYVAEYLPKLGFGLSQLRTATFGWEGVEKSFETIQDLAAHIFKELTLTRPSK